MSAFPPLPRPRGRATGFTLIEVMVATAVMAIMVVMIGGLFQQASSSWDAGYARAEGGMAVRAVVGSLTRDLSTAIDGRRFGLSDPIEVGPTGITMYRLRPGTPGGGRDIEKVVYTGGRTVQRNGKDIYSGGTGTYGANFSFSAGATPSGTTSSSAVRPYENGTAFGSDIAWTVPYVKVRCELTRSGSFSGLIVRSLGRDGEFGTDDDIIIR